MLKRIRLKNFKLHEDTLIEAAPITVFIGPNNSGKSSIVQALLATRQAAARGTNQLLSPPQKQDTSARQPYNFPAGQIIDVGEFKDVLRHGQDEMQIGVVGRINLRKEIYGNDTVEIGFDVNVRGNALVEHSGFEECAYGKFQWRYSAPFFSPGLAHSIQVRQSTLSFTTTPNFRLIQYSSLIGAPPDEVGAIQQLGQFLGDAPVRLLESQHPVFPLRGFEEAGYPLPDDKPTGLEQMTVSDRAMALVSTLAYDRPLREKLSRRLEELLGITIESELVPGKRVKLWARRSAANGSGTLFANEGTGANQLPFILVPLALTPPNETILLSEPEAHLHPKKQYELTSQLLKIARKENIQFFIETHSEHVLHAVLHAIPKGDLARNDLAAYYFLNKDGVAEVQKLEVNERGQVEGGLRDFFEQSLSELTEYLDALRKP